jgi:hypothetical protein
LTLLVNVAELVAWVLSPVKLWKNEQFTRQKSKHITQMVGVIAKKKTKTVIA